MNREENLIQLLLEGKAEYVSQIQEIWLSIIMDFKYFWIAPQANKGKEKQTHVPF